jgi:hypothetical protein
MNATNTPAASFYSSPAALLEFLRSFSALLDVYPPTPGASAAERVYFSTNKRTRRNLIERAESRAALFLPTLLYRALCDVGLEDLAALPAPALSFPVLERLGMSRRELTAAFCNALRAYLAALYERARTADSAAAALAADLDLDSLDPAAMLQARAESWADRLHAALAEQQHAAARDLLTVEAPALAAELRAAGLDPAAYGLE